MRNEFLAERLGNLCERLSPPQAIRNSPQLQAEELKMLSSAVFAAAPSQGYEDWWPTFEMALLDLMTTRAWPTRNEIGKAVQTIRSASKGAGRDRVQTLLEWSREWLGSHKGPPPGMSDWSVTKQLIAEGAFYDEREARFRGWPLSKEDTRKAHDQRPSAEEWRHHVRVMARLKGVSEAEAEAVERAETSPGQLPQHLAGPKLLEAAE